jgi:hypothetical protein
MIKKNMFSERSNPRNSLLSDTVATSTRNSFLHLLTEYKYQHVYDHPFDAFSFKAPKLREVELAERLKSEMLKSHGWDDLKVYGDSGMTQATLPMFIKRCKTEHFFDLLEIYFCLLSKFEIRTSDGRSAKELPGELNDFFTRDRVGYRMDKDGNIVKIGSEFVYQNVLTPAITLLDTFGFKGPLEEYRKALEYYRKKDAKNAIHWANNAFESTLKAVTGKSNGEASKLIEDAIRVGLLPKYYEKTFQLLPITRNNMGGHGQGATPISINDSYAEFAINLSGVLIVFLIRRHHESKSKA